MVARARARLNLIARDMITQRSSMIGVVTAGFENPFRARLLSDLMAALGQRALTPLVTNAEDPRRSGNRSSSCSATGSRAS